MNQLGEILITNIKNPISKIQQNQSSRFDFIENAHFKANISLTHLLKLIKLLFYITPEFTTFKRSQAKYFDRKLSFSISYFVCCTEYIVKPEPNKFDLPKYLSQYVGMECV